MSARPRSEPPAQAEQAAGEAWRLLRALVLNHERRQEVSAALGLSFNRVRALRALAAEPLTMGQLAGVLTTDAPYTSVMVDDLVRRGLVERSLAPADRRIRLVGLTAAGRRIAVAASAILDRPPEALAGAPAAELDQLVDLLRRLVARAAAGA